MAGWEAELLAEASRHAELFLTSGSKGIGQSSNEASVELSEDSIQTTQVPGLWFR